MSIQKSTKGKLISKNDFDQMLFERKRKLFEKMMMRNIFLFFLLSFNLIVSQQSGIVTYEYSFHPEKLKTGLEEINNNYKQSVTLFMKKTEEYAKQHQWILKFTSFEAIYKVEDDIIPDDIEDPSAWRISKWTFGKGIFYQNAKDRYTLNQKEIFNKQYLVKDTIKNDWILSYEKRIIGGYKCYKAVRKNPKNRNFDVIAWYAPEIPVPFGPGRYNGTPGLILELNFGPHSLTMKKIRFENLSIQKPTKGKLINKNDYDQMLFERKRKLFEKMMMRKRN